MWGQRSEREISSSLTADCGWNRGTTMGVPFPAGFEHLHERMTWLCYFPSGRSLSQAYIGTNFRQIVGVPGICAGWVQAQQGALLHVALTLGCGIVSPPNSIPDGPCGERCGGPASSAHGTLFLWLVSCPLSAWLCPFSASFSCVWFSPVLHLSSQMARTLMRCCHYVYGTSWGL